MSGRLVVFDVDGTLVDSREILKRASDRAFRELGLAPPSYDALRQIVGLSLHEGLALLAPEQPRAVMDALIEHYKSSFQGLRREPGFLEPLYPGVEVLLAGLKAAGWRIAMATGKSRRGVEAIVEMHGWADLFETTHCSDDGPGKPHPAMLQAAMAALGKTPVDTVMVGDTAHDVRMAQAAGVRAVAVTWGFHTLEELRASRPDAIAQTFAELEAELARFGAEAD